jgi:hypothetical protein
LSCEPAPLECRSHSAYLEPESALRAVANADRAELAGVLPHPVAADAEHGGQSCRVDVVANLRLRPKQLDNPSGDGLDIGRSQDLRTAVARIRSMFARGA